MSRYVIQNALGLFHTYNKVDGRKYVPDPADPTRNNAVPLIMPVFGAMSALLALKYDTKQDAVTMLAYPDLNDSTGFEGCVVLEAEFDPDNSEATRAA